MVWFLGSLFSFHNFSIIDENDDVYVWPLGGGCEEKKKKKTKQQQQQHRVLLFRV